MLRSMDHVIEMAGTGVFIICFPLFDPRILKRRLKPDSFPALERRFVHLHLPACMAAQPVIIFFQFPLFQHIPREERSCTCLGYSLSCIQFPSTLL
jgi:hypothetical protein